MVYELSARLAEGIPEKEILRFLRGPSCEIIDFALTLVNLTEKEQAALTLCARLGHTQEEAAEQMDYSVDAVKKWYRSAMRKVRRTWSGHWWMEKICS
mgnify:CR=1 FL=1